MGAFRKSARLLEKRLRELYGMTVCDREIVSEARSAIARALEMVAQASHDMTKSRAFELYLDMSGKDSKGSRQKDLDEFLELWNELVRE